MIRIEHGGRVYEFPDEESARRAGFHAQRTGPQFADAKEHRKWLRAVDVRKPNGEQYPED